MEAKKEFEDIEKELKQIQNFEENIHIYADFLEKDFIVYEIETQNKILQIALETKENIQQEIQKLQENEKSIEYTIQNSSF
jgi:hypothetical protein